MNNRTGGGLPVRPTKAAVGVCLEGRYATVREQVLAAELLHIRACIENCKSVQRVNEEAAKEWELEARNKTASPDITKIAGVHARVYRYVANELAKALEGF